MTANVSYDSIKEHDENIEEKTVYWLYDEVFHHQFTPEQRQRTVDWFAEHFW